ncbi:MAG: ATP-binding protein [Cyclobacteriaceae bacterium]
MQDSLGFLWFLHDNGLSRYDGYNFKVYLYDTTNQRRLGGGASSRDGMLALDNSENICIINQNRINPDKKLTLTRYDRKKDAFTKYFPAIQEPIVSICFEKKSSRIWLGAGSGKGLYSFNTENRQTAHYLNDQSDIPDSSAALISPAGLKLGSSMVEENTIMAIQDQDSIFLLVTLKGLWNFNKETKKFKRPLCNPRDSALLYDSPFVFLFASEETEYLWLVRVIPGGVHGFVKVNRNLAVIYSTTHPPLDGEVAVCDKDGTLWFTTSSHGLYNYNPTDSSFIKIENTTEDRYSLRSDFLRGITIDRDQNIWVTTTDRGITMLKKQIPTFHNYTFKGEVTGRVIYHANGQDYLVLARNETSRNGDNEILFSPIIPNRLQSINFQALRLKTKINGQVNQLFKGRNNLWIGTWNHGVFSLPVNPSSGRIDAAPLLRLQPDPKNPNTISEWGATGIWEDSSANLWVGIWRNGLNKVDLRIPYGKEGSVVRYRNIPGDSTSLGNDMIWWEFYPKDKESFLAVTASGIDLFRNGSFEHVFKNENSMTIRQDSKGIFLIGTTEGLFESMKESNYIFKKNSSVLLDKYGAFALQEDGIGKLWITNHSGLVCFDRKEKNTIIFTEADDMKYSRDWIGLTSKGVMITSDPHGITVFDPLSLRIDKTNPSVVLTHLTVNNQFPLIESTTSGSDEFNIKKAITVLDELVLDYKHNNFTIEFSAMEMTSPEKNLYRHRLEGYDNDWIETDWKSRTATYTNLDAGTYIFKVTASNYHGIWNDNETTLAVVILPPPWKTWWAYTLYGLLFVGMILYWRSYEIKRVRLKQRAAYLSELDHVKTRFFANISHEFRTPITLILGPLKEFYKNTTNPDQKTTFGVMIRNGQRLLRLINQLLDLSKIEAGKMQLHSTKVDLVEFLREIAASYESLASEKGIKYTFNPEVRELAAFLDIEKMEKVMHNILSNAFKFTKAGEVNLSLKVQEKESVVIKVTDTGAGIPPDHLNKVFDRFYQVDSSKTRGYEGSGLGMALAKELIELHHGKISVESTEGKGTTFTVWMPLGKEKTGKVETTDRGYPEGETISEDHVLSHATISERGNGKPAESSEEHPVLLIVEDNADMRNYIRRTLFEHYHILEAANGGEGLQKAQEIVPDLIISDIMMPEMDGYKLCELIKTNELTSHIPVILLTAKADRASRLSGLETGADDYLSKPFDADELKLIIRNRIVERRKMRERFSREITLEPRQIAITSLDEKFLQKVLGIIEIHMDDESFSIVELSEQAGYSHIHFYRKIKALSGQTPNMFLRTIRLKRAAEMLRNKSDNVAQIAYSVGFSSQSYFIKCFKDQFGMTPGQFMEGASIPLP